MREAGSDVSSEYPHQPRRPARRLSRPPGSGSPPRRRRRMLEKDIRRLPTEPDIMLIAPGQMLICIEAKFASANPLAHDGPTATGAKPTTREGLLARYLAPSEYAKRRARSILGQPRRQLRSPAPLLQSAASPASPTHPWPNLWKAVLQSTLSALHACDAKQIALSPWGAPLPARQSPFADSRPQRMHPAKFPASLGLQSPGLDHEVIRYFMPDRSAKRHDPRRARSAKAGSVSAHAHPARRARRL